MVTWQMVTRSHSAYLTWSAVSSAAIGVETGHNDGHMADGALVTHSIQYTILGQQQTVAQ